MQELRNPLGATPRRCWSELCWVYLWGGCGGGVLPVCCSLARPWAVCDSSVGLPHTSKPLLLVLGLAVGASTPLAPR